MFVWPTSSPKYEEFFRGFLAVTSRLKKGSRSQAVEVQRP